MAKSYPMAKKLSKILGSTGNNKRVLSVMNCFDGMGDEVIRMNLLQRLLVKYPKVKVTIFTKYDFLYEETSSVSVKTIDDFKSEKDGSTDVVLDHSANHLLEEPSTSKAKLLKKEGLYIKTAGDKIKHHSVREVFSNKKFYIKEGFLKSGESLLEKQNVYSPILRLGTMLGLPLSVIGKQSIFLGKNKSIHKLINKYLNISKSKDYIVFNPFGNPNAKVTKKGYTNKKYLKKDLVTLLGLSSLTLLCVFYKKDLTRAKDLIKQLTPEQHKKVKIINFARKHKIAPKHFVANAKKIVTCEGGLMHLAYALSRPYIIILAQGGGSKKWFPPGTPSNNIVKMGNL